MMKNVKHIGTKYSSSYSFLQYTNFKDDLLEYKCLSCDKSY